MGLSTIAAYGILFTASLFMLSVILNSFLYSYDSMQNGMKDRVEIINSAKNTIDIDRIFYENGNIMVRGLNRGPETLKTEYINLIVNGTDYPFNKSGDYWYPGDYAEFSINSSYDIGKYHGIQFSLYSQSVIAAAVEDKIYTINSTTLIAYNFTGEELWERKISGPKDVTVSSYIYVLNSTGIMKYDLNGDFISLFGKNLNLLAIDSLGNRVYGVNSSSLVIFDSNGNLISSDSLTNGKDVACGKQLYVLDGNSIKIYDPNGTYLSSFTDSIITNATKISSDNGLSQNYVFILNGNNEILIYRDGKYIQEIHLENFAENIEIYGKIYICSRGIYAMDMGYRIKLVDEFGNEFYDFL